MTPEYIMRKSLCRPAHCYRAHVLGKGYVNDGTLESTRADYDKQRNREAQSEIDNLGYAKEYSERGYQNDQPQKGILMANWNVFPRGLDTILERYGYAIEWSDEWMTCDGCNNAIRTSADSYVWEPSYVMVDDSTPICRMCAADEKETQNTWFKHLKSQYPDLPNREIVLKLRGLLPHAS